MLLDYLLERTPFTLHQLQAIIKTATHRYKRFEIPKRNSDNKRVIYQPSKELKYIQRIIVSDVLGKFEVHKASMAYKEDISILDNAKIHAGTNFLLRMDFKDFFPSITKEIIERVLKNNSENLSHSTLDDITIIGNIVCRRNALTIGAPSSPFLSNIVMFNFDVEVSTFAKEHKINYTRYADDLFFSTNQKHTLKDIKKFVEILIKNEHFSFLKINTDKTYNASKAYSRKVTGLVLTPDGNISLGRERKRHIKKLLYKNNQGLLGEKEKKALKGLLSFAKHIEPTFYDKEIKRYSYCQYL